MTHATSHHPRPVNTRLKVTLGTFLLLCLLSFLSDHLFADLSCMQPRRNGRGGEFSMDYLVQTDSYRLVAESAEGANGDVVPVTLWLHSNFENPGWVSLAVSVCHNPDAVEIVGEPEFSDDLAEILGVGGALYFPVDEDVDPQNHVGHGFLLVLHLNNSKYDERFPSQVPMPIGTVYYRLKGEPGDRAEISFCNGELDLFNALCNTNHLNAVTRGGGPGQIVISTENESGILTVTDGPVTQPNRPPTRPRAKVYPELPSDEEIDFRVRIPAQTARPGSTEIPVDVFVSAGVESSGLVLPINFDERYLRLSRLDKFLPGGVNFIDNADVNPGNDVNEGFVLITSALRVGGRRLLDAGEELHVATLYFDVLDTAVEVAETSLTVEQVTRRNRDHTIPYDPSIFVLVKNNAFVQGGGETREQVAPISVQHGRLALQAARVTLGDVNFDSRLDLSDVVGILDFLFRGGDLVCTTAADVNGDERINIADPVRILLTRFRMGTEPPGEQVPCF